MRSFGILSLAATAAFSLLAAAAPFIGSGLNVRSDPDVGKVLDGVTDKASVPSTHPGGPVSDLKSVPKILSGLEDNLKSVIDEIKSLTSDSATEDTVQPLLKEIIKFVDDAVKDVTKLVGSPIKTILASVDDSAQIDVKDVVKLVAELLELVISALAGLLKLIGNDLSIVGDLLATIGDLLCNLLNALLKVVDGLLDELLSLVKDLLDDIDLLNYKALHDLLQLN